MIDIFDGFKTIKSGSEMKSKLKPPTKAGETEVWLYFSYVSESLWSASLISFEYLDFLKLPRNYVGYLTYSVLKIIIQDVGVEAAWLQP